MNSDMENRPTTLQRIASLLPIALVGAALIQLVLLSLIRLDAVVFFSWSQVPNDIFVFTPFVLLAGYVYVMIEFNDSRLFAPTRDNGAAIHSEHDSLPADKNRPEAKTGKISTFLSWLTSALVATAHWGTLIVLSIFWIIEKEPQAIVTAFLLGFCTATLSYPITKLLGIRRNPFMTSMCWSFSFTFVFVIYQVQTMSALYQNVHISINDKPEECLLQYMNDRYTICQVPSLDEKRALCNDATMIVAFKTEDVDSFIVGERRNFDRIFRW